MTKTLRKSIKCIPLTLQTQTHTFGSGTIAHSQSSGVVETMNVNPPAKAKRSSKVPGRAPANLGRPHKAQTERTQMVVRSERDIILARTQTTSHINVDKYEVRGEIYRFKKL